MEDRSWPSHDPFGPKQQTEIILPTAFREICIMIGKQPMMLAFDFMMDVVGDSLSKPGSDDNAIEAASDYCIIKGWGRTWFTTDQLRDMYSEIMFIGKLSTQQTNGVVCTHDYRPLREQYIAAWKAKWEAIKNANK